MNIINPRIKFKAIYLIEIMFLFVNLSNQWGIFHGKTNFELFYCVSIEKKNYTDLTINDYKGLVFISTLPQFVKVW